MSDSGVLPAIRTNSVVLVGVPYSSCSVRNDGVSRPLGGTTESREPCRVIPPLTVAGVSSPPRRRSPVNWFCSWVGVGDIVLCRFNNVGFFGDGSDGAAGPPIFNLEAVFLDSAVSITPEGGAGGGTGAFDWVAGLLYVPLGWAWLL